MTQKIPSVTGSAINQPRQRNARSRVEPERNHNTRPVIAPIVRSIHAMIHFIGSSAHRTRIRPSLRRTRE